MSCNLTFLSIENLKSGIHSHLWVEYKGVRTGEQCVHYQTVTIYEIEHFCFAFQLDTSIVNENIFKTLNNFKLRSSYKRGAATNLSLG